METEMPRKRTCVAPSDPPSTTYVSVWTRMMNKLRMKEHWISVYNVMITLMMSPIGLWARLITNAAKKEPIEALEEVNDLMQTAIQERESQIERKKLEKQATKRTHQKEIIQQIRQSSTATTSEMSFVVVDQESLTEENLRKLKKENKSKHHREDQPSEASLDRKCYCGLMVVEYTCRQEGVNFGRRFLRCPRTPASAEQCHYFKWIESTKSSQGEQMGIDRAWEEDGKSSHQVKHVKARDPPRLRLSSSSSSEHVSTPKVNKKKNTARSSQEIHRGEPCSHVWSRRGTNVHQEMKTCKLCGERQVLKHKTGELIRTWVEPGSMK